MSQESLRIVEVKSDVDLLNFVKIPLYLYSADNFYAPQLIKDQLKHYSAANPFFKFAEVKFFISYKGQRAVGRIASIINYNHIDYHNEKVGFFGLFECINDKDVSRILLDAVCEVLIKKRLSIIRGPMNLSTNEECGFLLEGFETPPMIMTPYNPPFYNELMEYYGMKKAKDLFAFIYDIPEELPERVIKVAEIAEKTGIRCRKVDIKNFTKDMLAFREVYNSAWQHNWGFIPLTEEELFYSAERLKKLIVPEFTLLAYEDKNPVGFFGALPDFNLVLRHLRGKITPFNFIKAFYYLKKITDLRLLLFGIKKDFRRRGIDALLFREAFRNFKRKRFRFKRVEFSWILEDNLPTIRIIDLFNAKPYKKFRLYEKNL
ncbi:MAG: hypothetical protein N2511_00850 [Thermodesulfovibrionales bacterium]|nr:hypothetical protein [Thermodesulfovibrionales bacterium]